MTDRQWENDAAAWAHLESRGFTHTRGIIKPPITDLDYRHDWETRSAINYLCDDWDWSYEP